MIGGLDKRSGGLAHDFNNLLGVIIGNLVLADRLLHNSPEVRELISEAADAASRGVELARNLLALSRGQSKGPASLDLNTVLSRMQRLLHRIVGEGVKIAIKLDAELWPVLAQVSQFESSLLNLAANARDAMSGAGDLLITTENCRIDADFGFPHPAVRSGDYVKISVEDTGCGMDPETLAQAFKPFFTTKEDVGGTGLGLSMVLDFVHRSGGHISTRSAVGQGTTICLLLPRAAEDGYFMSSTGVATQPLPSNAHPRAAGEHGCQRTSARQ
jgi:signal transduction histidine kinase